MKSENKILKWEIEINIRKCKFKSGNQFYYLENKYWNWEIEIDIKEIEIEFNIEKIKILNNMKKTILNREI